MKNTFILTSWPENTKKMKLRLTFIKLLACFSIFILTILNISPVLAAIPVLPVFRMDIEILAYPSGSPQATIADKQVIKAINQMRDAGFADRVEKIFLAYKNKDVAWDTAQTILNKIQDGQINSENISDYVSPDFKLSFKSENKMASIFKKIRSYGDLANLSIKKYKGVFPDRMLLKKEFNQDRITIRVIDFVYHDLDSKNIKNPPVSYIMLALSAEPPYKNWFLSEIYIKKFS